MLDLFKVKLQYLLPKHLLSRLVGLLAAAKAGGLTTWLIERFIRHYRVDMSEAKFPEAHQYDSFNDFFTRELAPGVRPIDPAPEVIVHAVDGAISQCGTIDDDRIFQAKGHDFSLTTLLGGNPVLAKPFKGGSFATVYLSPRDYHRIHMPIEGTLTDMLYIPGELFSVNPLTTREVPGLFARNERVVALFDTPAGRMAMVLVGATIVASIETVWAGTVTPPAGKHVQHWQYDNPDQPIHLPKGAELGRFKLGSTIVMCFEPDAVDLSALAAGQVTRLGEACGTLLKAASAAE